MTQRCPKCKHDDGTHEPTCGLYITPKTFDPSIFMGGYSVKIEDMVCGKQIS